MADAALFLVRHKGASESYMDKVKELEKAENRLKELNRECIADDKGKCVIFRNNKLMDEYERTVFAIKTFKP